MFTMLSDGDLQLLAELGPLGCAHSCEERQSQRKSPQAGLQGVVTAKCLSPDSAFRHNSSPVGPAGPAVIYYYIEPVV